MAMLLDPHNAGPDDFPERWKLFFWERVDTSGECWLWTRGRLPSGYGLVCTKSLPWPRHQDYAHRIAWMITNGPIPEGMVVCHHCDNPSCVRPDHLFLGTQADNVRDMIRKGRQAPPSNLRLTDEDVDQIRRAYATGGVTFFDLADQFDISFQYAHAIVRGRKRARKAA